MTPLKGFFIHDVNSKSLRMDSIVVYQIKRDIPTRYTWSCADVPFLLVTVSSYVIIVMKHTLEENEKAV